MGLLSTEGFYPEGIIAGFIFFSSNKFSKILTKQIFRIGQHMFECVKTMTEYPEKNNIMVNIYLHESMNFYLNFFFGQRALGISLENL